MRLTNHVPRTVLWSFLLGVMLGNSAAAQQPPPPPPAKAGSVLVVPINGTQRVQMSNKGRIDKVLNPKDSVVRVSPVLGDPTSVLVTGLDSGVARITLIGEGNRQEEIEILVQFDVEYLRTLLGRVVPTAAVNPVPGSNGAVILTGTVAHAEDIDIIMRTTISVVGGPERVINAMRVGGVMQVQLDTVVATVNRSAIRSMGFNLLQSGPSAIFGSVVGNIAPVQTAGTTPPSTFGGNGQTSGSGGGSSGSGQTGLITGGLINSAPGAANLFLGVVTKSGSFFGFLEALRQEGLVKLLTEPRLVTMSGEPASLLSGGRQAIPEAQGLGTISVRFEPFGTTLNFLPIVLGTGKIHLDIQTVVSQLDQSSGTTINGTSVPGRTEQSARTVVEIEDGQTLAIGGLIQHIAQAGTNKVPILGDLPYVGAAFSTKTYTDTEQELVILVTPHVVDPMACNQLPKSLPGEETRKPDDYELFLEGIMEAPRGPRVPFPDRRFVPAYKNGPTAALYPCAGDGRCGQPVHPPADPAGDSSSHVNKLPLGTTEAKPLPPVVATPIGNPEARSPVAVIPPASRGESAASPPGTTPPVETVPAADANKPTVMAPMPATLPAALPGPANTEGKQ
jgi:pilus assembly protein CpaC